MTFTFIYNRNSFKVTQAIFINWFQRRSRKERSKEDSIFSAIEIVFILLNKDFINNNKDSISQKRKYLVDAFLGDNVFKASNLCE